jgi:16S rRNA C1402 N4-methylase RsmH
MKRISALLRVAIASINKSPRERKTFINQFIRQIVKPTGEDFEPFIDENLRRLQNLQNVPARGDIFPDLEDDDDDDEDVEGGAMFDMGISRFQKLYGKGSLDRDEEGVVMRRDGPQDHRFSRTKGASTTRVIRERAPPLIPRRVVVPLHQQNTRVR